MIKSKYMELTSVIADDIFFNLLGDACQPDDWAYYKQEIANLRARAYQVQSAPIIAMATKSPKFEFNGYAIISETDDELVLNCYAGNLLNNAGSGSSKALIIAFKQYTKELHLHELRIHTQRHSAFDKGLRDIPHTSREVVYRIGVR